MKYTLELTPEEVYCLLASLNYTRNRTKSSSWEDRDERIWEKLNVLSNTVNEFEYTLRNK